MPPDDTDGLDDADLPGLDDDTPSTEADGWDDADLPGLGDSATGSFSEGYDAVGLEADSASPTSTPTSEPQPGRLVDDVDIDGGAPDSVTGELAPYGPDYSNPPASGWRKGLFDQGGTEGEVPDSVIGELAPYGPDHSGPPKPPVPRWIWVGGGFGILGLVLVAGIYLGGGDDDGAVAVPSDVAIVETTAPSTASTVADTETPAVAVETPEESVVVFGPGDYVRCREATVVADLNGDAWIMATPIAPWLSGPDRDTTWSLILDVGIDLGTQSNSVRWTLYDGGTRGESHISGDNVKAALDAEMWVTPEGQVAVKLPGTSPTGGLSVSDIGPDAGITWFGQLWPEEDSEIQNWDETKPLGEVGQATDALPRPGWERVETDFGPITLIIPDTSDN